MSDVPQDLGRLSPERLVAGFSRSKILVCLLIAIGAHVFVIGATSLGYIRDTWIDPEGAAKRKAAQLEAQKAESERLAAAEAAAEAASKRPAEPGKPPGTATPAAKTKEEEKAEARKKAPIVEEITKLPKKGEIPKQPDDLGISIDETNR